MVLVGFFSRALTGVGWAGTYMTGLKLLADKVEGKLMSRATADTPQYWHLRGALLRLRRSDRQSLAGWRAAFLAAAVSAQGGMAFDRAGLSSPVARAYSRNRPHALFDFRPVFRNRSAMAYALTYCIHTFEFHAVRGWGVVFLAFVAGTTGSEFFLSRPWLLPCSG
jgi:hypothetical protein